MLMLLIRNRLRPGKKHSTKTPILPVLEELPWCADGRGVIQGKRMRLFVYDTLTTELFPLTDTADELRQRFHLS